MGAIFECDACKKQEPGEDKVGLFVKPKLWFQRDDGKHTEVVCSPECGMALNEKTNTQSMIVESKS